MSIPNRTMADTNPQGKVDLQFGTAAPFAFQRWSRMLQVSFVSTFNKAVLNV